MTGFTTGSLVLPTTHLGKLRMRSVRVSFELILVAIFACLTTDVVSGAVHRWFGLTGLNRLRRSAGGKPHDRGSQRTAKNQRLDNFDWTQRSSLTLCD